MKKILQNKNIAFAVLGVALGLILVIIGNIDSDVDTTSVDHSPTYTSNELETYTENLEAKVRNILSKIGGVSNVDVIISIDGSSESVFATEGSNKDFVIIKDSSGNESALQVMEINATVRGIAVVCDYGNDENLKVQIINMLAALFNIGSNRISVISS